MTPAIEALRKLGIEHRVHSYESDVKRGYGAEAAEALGQDPARIFKTLLAKLDGKELVVAIVPVAAQLDLKRLAKGAGAKKAAMADVAEAERATGYVAGGISPLGQRKRLATYLDRSGLALDTVFVSAGRRGLEIELAPADLVAATKAKALEIAT